MSEKTDVAAPLFDADEATAMLHDLPPGETLSASCPAEPNSVTHRLLMCPPRHFAVDYVINPWMRDHVAAADQPRAMQQWQSLVQAAQRAGATTEQVHALQGLPDMVFTANAGLVLGKTFVPSRFLHPERSGEEALFIDWFHNAGFRVRELPGELAFEGAGDALLDRGMPRLWMGYGHRSDIGAAAELERMLDLEVVPLRLIDPRFYHLDTCFCPLADGVLMYYPDAFDDESRLAIEHRIPRFRRVQVTEADALAFACNAVDLDDTVVMNRASTGLRQALEVHGYRAVEVPLDEFLKAGGSAKCLTLRLDEPAIAATRD